MPFSRHARPSTSGINANLRVVDEDPLRFGAAAGAGPGPAAVAAANARARRNGGNITPNDNNANANPPAGLNARRNRQRVQNAYNANNINDQAGDDPGQYYYRRVPPPQRAAPRGGRRRDQVYAGLLRNLDEHPDDWDDHDYVDGVDNFDELDLELPHGYDMAGLHRWGPGGGGNGRRGAGAGAIRGMGAFQNILEMIGFGVGAGNPAWLNAQPAHFNPGNPPKRKVKAYSVKQSHPNFNKKKDGKDGYERDIVPPPEIEEEEPAVEEQKDQQSEATKEEKAEEVIPDLSTAPSADILVPAAGEQDDASTRRSSRNKGKGRALEVEIPSLNSTSVAAATDSNSDIPVLDLAHDSPNGSGSTASSTLFSGKLSNSTRATSTEQMDEPADSKVDQAILLIPAPPAAPTTRTIRAPVCTSCSTALYLNQSSTGRPYVLVCGHVICKGCLELATARYKRFNAEEQAETIDDAGDDSSLPPIPSTSTAWKGSRLKETFEEVDRSRSSTSAATAKHKKLKKRAPGMRVGAPGSSRASTSAPTARASRAAGRRNVPLPDYADLADNVEEGQGADDGSYLPRTAREDSVSSSASSAVSVLFGEASADRKSRMGQLSNVAGEGAQSQAGVQNTASQENGQAGRLGEGEGEEAAGSAGADTKGKGKARANDEPLNGEDDASTETADNNTTGKRKRTKADVGGKSSNANSKTKKQKVEKPPKIDLLWIVCPVVACKGGTDLGKPVGSREGAWELFV